LTLLASEKITEMHHINIQIHIYNYKQMCVLVIINLYSTTSKEFFRNDLDLTTPSQDRKMVFKC